MLLPVSSASLSKEEILYRAAEFGIDLSLLREQLKLSPTERLESHKQFLLSVESFAREVNRARRRSDPQDAVKESG
jgi:hypothetical protein